MASQSPDENKKLSQSLSHRVLGDRSLFSWIFGTFFSDSTNTSGLLAVGLVASVIFFQYRSNDVPARLLDAVFIIVGFYFGGATAKKSDSNAKI